MSSSEFYALAGSASFDADHDTLPVGFSGRMGFDALFLQWDDDAQVDLYTANDMFTGNVLYLNEGGSLVAWDESERFSIATRDGNYSVETSQHGGVWQVRVEPARP